MSAIEEANLADFPRNVSPTITSTSCSGCGYGNGRNSAESITLKSAVDTPVPRARVRIATAENARCLRRSRTP
jgi:hypothetical protein